MASGHISEVQPYIESHIKSLRGGGQPLSENDRAYFELRFGRDFSQVRVHTDAKSAEVAMAMNARAFTVRQDVVSGAGQYVTGISAGRRLLAHELTHVVQQQSSGEKIRHVLQRTPGDAVRALNIAVDEWDNTIREFPPCSNRGPNAEVNKYLGGRRGRVQSYIMESGINAASLGALILSNGA